MKNLLLASSVLAMTAGVAAAQDRAVSFGGNLAFGIAINGTGEGGLGNNADSVLPNNQYHVYSTMNLVLTVAGTSDTGLSFGTTLELDAGPSYTLGDEDGFEDNDGSWSAPAIFVTGTWGTVTFSSNDIDFYDDSAFNGGGDGTLITNQGVDTGEGNTGDFKYEGTWGGFFTGLIVDIETGDASAQVGYNLYGVDILADYSVDSAPSNDSGALWNVNLGYNWETFNFAVGADNDNDEYIADYFARVGTTFAGIDAYVQYNNNSGEGTNVATWDVGAGYSNGPFSLNADAENIASENNDPLKWTVTAEYALASGVVVEAGTNYTGDALLGAKFSF